MIQAFPNRFEGFADVGVIHHPAESRIQFAVHNYFDLKTVAMQTPTLVRFGQARQQMRRFKLKSFA
jgi:hypothetical protein